MSAERVVHRLFFDFKPHHHLPFEPFRIECKINPKPERFSKQAVRSQDMIGRHWEQGSLAILQMLTGGNPRVDLKTALDWSQDSYQLTDRDIAEILKRKSPKAVSEARKALNVGELNPDRQTRRYTREELLRLMVATLAYTSALIDTHLPVRHPKLT